MPPLVRDGRRRLPAGGGSVFPGLAVLLASLFLPGYADETERAAFDWFEYMGSDARFDLPKVPAEYRNPVLAGFYPDPSMVRVGDDFYLVTSTFAWYPGVPIFHSTDLVNWTQIGHVLDRPSLMDAEGLGVSRGIFAPTLRYNDGTFYMVTTMVGGRGNFYVTATDPAGPWSEPVWLSDVDGIDPSIFFDDDGRAWLLNNGPPEGDPRYDGHRAIWIQELDVKAGRLLGPRKVIVDGGVDLSTNPIWIEGPHLFRVGDWYYLIAAEGGTGDQHSEVVFRSRDVMGPYEPGPRNPILTQRTLDPDRPWPVTNTGHADFVQARAGDWWAVFLGCRPYEPGLFNTGRETFLLPVAWEDGWPTILAESASVPPVAPKPDLPPGKRPEPPHNGNFSWRDDFDGKQLSLAWNSLRGPYDAWTDLSSESGVIEITALDERLPGTETPAYLARRQQHGMFSASTSMHLPESQDLSAGIAAFQNETHHFYLGVRRADDGWIVFLEQAAGGEPELIKEQRFGGASSRNVYLRIEGAGRPYTFSWATETDEWQVVADGIDGSILSTEVAGGFVGTYVGLHARTESVNR